MRRTHSVMLRLNDEEFDALVRAKPDNEELASFARSMLVASATAHDPNSSLRLAAAYIVASLSPDLTFEEACGLFDDYVSDAGKEVALGRRD